MTEPTPTSVPLDPARLAKLMEGVGRCIFLYQRIEMLLKLLLPHMETTGLSADDEPVVHWRSLLDSKKTLGAVVQAFNEKNNADNPGDFPEYLEELVNQRNILVHKFFFLSDGRLSFGTDLESRIREVHGSIRFAEPFAQTLEAMAAQFAADLQQSIAEEEAGATKPESE